MFASVLSSKKGNTSLAFPGPFPASLRTAPALIVLSVLLFSSCRTFSDIASPGVGSARNPVRVHMPEGERAYLKRLRTEKGLPVSFKYSDAVLGPEGKVLDRFLLINPGHGDCFAKLSLFDAIFDGLGQEPRCPRKFRIYMDMYNPDWMTKDPIPGYSILLPQ